MGLSCSICMCLRSDADSMVAAWSMAVSSIVEAQVIAES
jgi:hypothetical protein